MLHIDISRMLHVDKIFLALKGKKYANIRPPIERFFQSQMRKKNSESNFHNISRESTNHALNNGSRIEKKMTKTLE